MRRGTGDSEYLTSVRDGSAVAMESTLRVQQEILGRYLGDALVSTNENFSNILFYLRSCTSVGAREQSLWEAGSGGPGIGDAVQRLPTEP